MDKRSSTGLFGTLTIVFLTVLGIWGLLTGYILESPGEWLVPTIGTLAVTAAVVGLLVVVGARSKRWRQNPYW
jgi:quinol-cytochrome oxidoreductase complex cytochrome b subunit